MAFVIDRSTGAARRPSGWLLCACGPRWYIALSSSTYVCRRHRAAGSIAVHEDQGPRAGRWVHEVFTMGLGMFFSAQSRKTSNSARAVDPSMPMCVARPGGNATGTNGFSVELVAKRMALLHELVPKAVRVAVLFNPATAGSEPILREAEKAARAIGLQIHVLNASTSREIDAAFAALERERPDALFVATDSFYFSRRVQIATLAARERIPSAYSARDFVEAGGLMSYGTDQADRYRQVGVYTGNILKGAKPADLPVMQSTKFEFVINLKTAKTLGLTIPETLLATADEVIQ